MQRHRRTAQQLAEQYGDDVASDVMARSRSNLQVDSQYGSVRGDTPGYNQSTFNSQGGYGTVPHGGSEENVRR